MKRLLRLAHPQFYLVMLFLPFCVSCRFSEFLSRKPSRYKSLNVVRKWSAFLPSLLSGITYKIRYKQQVNWDRPFIVVANHSSNLDIFAMSVMMKGNYFFLGKDELLDHFVTSLYFKTIDVPINRQSKMSSYKAFKKCEERLKDNMSLVIFAEGKIGDEYPPMLHPFKSGPFRLAIDNQIPVLPVTIVNSWEKMWDDGSRFGLRPGVCRVVVHELIDTAHLGEKDEEKLKDNVFEIVHSALNYQK